ncbi:MAG: T9SS type A sorting domain-containing protein [Crocinitomicaceae bacterium]
MKNITLSIFFFTCLNLQAQDFSVEVSDTTAYGLVSTYTFDEDIDLYNNLGSPFSMNWERIEESVPTGWETSNCDPDGCKAIGVTNAAFTLPTLPAYLNAHFYPNGIAGSGYMKVKLWSSATPSDSVVLTYYGVAGTASIEELQAADIQAFPSPASNTLNILFPNAGEALDVNIYNMRGQLVDSFETSQGNLTNHDVSQLETGVYILHFHVPGKVSLKKRFVKE